MIANGYRREALKRALVLVAFGALWGALIAAILVTWRLL